MILLSSYWLWQGFGWTLQHSVVRRVHQVFRPSHQREAFNRCQLAQKAFKNLIGLLWPWWKPLSNFLPALSRTDMWNKSMDLRNAPSVRFDFVVHYLRLTTGRWMNDFWHGDDDLTQCILAALTVIKSSCADGNTLTRREEESWSVTHSFLKFYTKDFQRKASFQICERHNELQSPSF